ncbi:Response regulator ArlR [Paraliobacillus sp. PM-2]|uniref:response regulator transcription factor n=1 Tax=Paraliobacillus sp. PM-2 TaxID=1462524 RepID=UPI00061C2B20|nr:response regulator transcription factor [Paraliobacillus sp. PM-2]CQR45899.1 Response regulator ArlR [Paraliobacillus sp. PM-2]
MTRILIVEDEASIARVLALELKHEGYQVITAETGDEGLMRAESESWDLLLLDVMLPERSGMDILRRLRSGGNATPVIMLTARDAVPDKVSGLDQGANDYVTKPFDMEELLARVRACLRQGHTAVESEVFTVADLSANVQTRQVTRANHPIELTPREFDLLIYLLRNKDIVLTRDQLLHNVWGFDYAGETNVVDVYIRYLRQKIDHNYTGTLIQTVRGVGYVLREAT